jgi:hypothetical protein
LLNLNLGAIIYRFVGAVGSYPGMVKSGLYM